MKRPTILDIARAAGVSKGAVSYALNGRPGVSPATRDRILGIAAELGWVPSSAARALSNDRAAAVGLVATKDPRVVASEPYFMRVVAGIEEVLAERDTALTLAIVSDVRKERDTYRRWWNSRRVDGVLLLDMRTNDPRPRLLRELGAPAVVLGARRSYAGLGATRVDDRDAMERAVKHLVERGHRRIARVTGPRRLEYVIRRGQDFEDASHRLTGSVGRQLEADYTAQEGVRCSRVLLAEPERPTAIIYDNDVMAVATVAALTGEGLRVPGDLAVLAWDDSPLCELVRPTVTAFTHDVSAEAGTAAELLLRRISDGAAPDVWMPARELTVRGSTGA